MYEGVLVVHVILAALLVGLVLLQQGKSGGMGTAFGGATEALLSTPGASNILSRSTAIIATCFFVTSLGLGYLATHKSQQMNDALIPEAGVPTGAVIPQPDTVLMTVPQEVAPPTFVAPQAPQQITPAPEVAPEPTPQNIIPE